MGGKSGGGFDAGPSIEYGNKALALQKQIYGDQVDRTEPFYEGGLNAFNMLLDGIGAQGGSLKSRDQYMDDFKDQYTTTTPMQNTGMYIAPDGRVLDLSKGNAGLEGSDWQQANAAEYFQKGNYDKIDDMGWKALGSTSATSQTDYDALNAAVDEAMAGQQTPDNYGHLLETFGMDDFQADPGYQFRLDEQNKAIERGAAARGQYYDPSTMKALQERGGNLADQTYGDAYNRFNNDQNTIFNRLAAVSGIGQTANNSLNQSSANYGNQVSNTYGQMGSAIQSAQNANASQPSMFDTLLGMGTQLGSAYFMSDIRTKENVSYVGKQNGIPLIKFNYIGDDRDYIGVSAQDVEKIVPDAVKEENGVKMVNYDMIGVKMREVN